MRWDLLQATCQSSMQPRNEHDQQLTSDSNIKTNSDSSSRSDYLIQAVRTQSALGALVGILSLVLIAVGVGWGWTCWRLVEKRKELRMRSTQTKWDLHAHWKLLAKSIGNDIFSIGIFCLVSSIILCIIIRGLKLQILVVSFKTHTTTHMRSFHLLVIMKAHPHNNLLSVST